MISLGALFNEQWKEMITGRRNAISWLSKWQRPDSQKIVWMHCASLGEFEQGRPLLELIKDKQPGTYILLSFFSPSGFRQMKSYDKADHVFYLPSDTRVNAALLVNTIKPDIFINVKYEFWWNLLHALSWSETRIYQISAVFRNSDYFFKAYLQSLKSILDKINVIFVQDALSQDVLISNGIKSEITVAGDTRVDRVLARTLIVNTPEDIAKKLLDQKVIIYGSVWDTDMHIVKSCVEMLRDYIHVIVPHDIKEGNVNNIISILGKPVVLYSKMEESSSADIFIIDKIGLLSGLYRYARYAYIGGGFQKGIHNTLEPAAYGLPVFFGPNHLKFIEAVAMKNLDLCYSVEKSDPMLQIIEKLDQNDILYNQKSEGILSYIRSSSNATAKIYNSIFP